MMRVFVVGASGAIGTRLVPQLIHAGHQVIGTSRAPEKAARLNALGADYVALDLLDREAVIKAVVAAKPDAVIHEATALADIRFSRNLDRGFEETNRLRTEGTDKSGDRRDPREPTSGVRASVRVIRHIERLPEREGRKGRSVRLLTP